MTVHTEHVLNTTSEMTTIFADMTSYIPPQRSQWEIALVAMVLLLIIIIALGGNILVIITVTTDHVLTSQESNLFIVNLCVTDLCSAVVVMCTGLVALVGDLKSVFTPWCYIVCAANYCFIIVSMTTLSCISVERMIAVCCSLRYHQIVTKNRVKIMCIYLWIQGLAFAFAPVGLGWVHYDYWEVICAIDWQVKKQTAVYYVIVAFIANFGIPGMVMLVAYIVIMKKAREIRMSVAQQTLKPRSSDSNVVSPHVKEALKTITSLLVVVLFFFICMTPFCVTKLLKVIVKDPGYVPTYANLTASLFQYMCSMVNPFIYAIFRKEFSLAFQKIFLKIGDAICCTGSNATGQRHTSNVDLSLS